MTRPQIRRVAVIGAGISGVVSAAHLLQAGLDVTAFERSHAAGGDERVAPDPSYTSLNHLSRKGIDEDKSNAALTHAPPGPCYDGLKNNVSTPLMRVKLNPWPEGTPDFVSHSVMKEYIRDTSRKTGVNDITIYGARVKNLSKQGDSWQVTWTRLKQQDDGFKEEERISILDAIIVAKPEGYEKKNVLIIGRAVSAIDIAREIGPQADIIYQSTRNGEFDISANILPENGVWVSDIARYEILDGIKVTDGKLPLKVHLKSGQVLCGLDQVIICTGYQFTLPPLYD
ncbi:hypothetical protein BDW68DRAFT_180841 [Aspergillus falconensis]